jgi:hypothetical protein
MTIRRYQIRAIGAAVEKIAKPLFGARGFGAASVVTQWPAIVGPVLARSTLPERIAYSQGERSEGALHLRVSSAGLALELQHLEPQLIQRINSHFGYRAVARIRLIQGPTPEKNEPKAKPTAPLAPEAKAAVATRVGRVADPDLKAALQALGEAVARAGRDGRKKAI